MRIQGECWRNGQIAIHTIDWDESDNTGECVTCNESDDFDNDDYAHEMAQLGGWDDSDTCPCCD